MTTFYLKKTARGRVYLSQIAPSSSEELLEEIDAEHWIAARETQVIQGTFEKFDRKEGYGFV